MKRFYEAERWRLRSPASTTRTGEGAHKFDATNDAEAIEAAKHLHAPFYDPAIDQIVIWEIRIGEDKRLVLTIEGPIAPRT
jgi:hypothetical protein